MSGSGRRLTGAPTPRGGALESRTSPDQPEGPTRRPWQAIGDGLQGVQSRLGSAGWTSLRASATREAADEAAHRGEQPRGPDFGARLRRSCMALLETCRQTPTRRHGHPARPSQRRSISAATRSSAGRSANGSGLPASGTGGSSSSSTAACASPASAAASKAPSSPGQRARI